MQQENNRNLVIFIVASLLIFGVYYWFVMRPIELRRAEAARAAAAQAPAEGVGPVPGASSSDSPSAFVDERTALSRSARVPVRTPALTAPRPSACSPAPSATRSCPATRRASTCRASSMPSTGASCSS
jgi:hypothetical protein